MTFQYGLSVTLDDLDKIAASEEEGYPADEMADKNTLKNRMEGANSYFKKNVNEDGNLVGFVCGTLSSSDVLTEDSMYGHAPEGSHLCIHSVCTLPIFQKQGHARRGLCAYLEAIAKDKQVTKISLIAKEHLVSFYKSCGFELVGLSSVVHGEDPWYELVKKN